MTASTPRSSETDAQRTAGEQQIASLTGRRERDGGQDPASAGQTANARGPRVSDRRGIRRYLAIFNHEEVLDC